MRSSGAEVLRPGTRVAAAAPGLGLRCPRVAAGWAASRRLPAARAEPKPERGPGSAGLLPGPRPGSARSGRKLVQVPPWPGAVRRNQGTSAWQPR